MTYDQLNLILNGITVVSVMVGSIAVAWMQYRMVINLTMQLEGIKCDIQKSQATVQTQIDGDAVIAGAVIERLSN